VRSLYDEAKPLAISVVDGKKDIIEIERRQVSPEEVQEYKDLIKKYPSMEGLYYSVHDPHGEGWKRKRADNVLKFVEKPDKLPMAVQALRIGDCMLYAVSGQLYSEFGLHMKKNSPSAFNMVAMMANGGDPNYIPTLQAFEMDLYEVQVPTSSLIPQAGYMIADHALELAKELVK